MSPWRRHPLTIPPDSCSAWVRLAVWEIWMGMLLYGALSVRHAAHRHRSRQHRHGVRFHELLRRSAHRSALRTRRLQSGRAERRVQRLVRPAADRRRGLAPVGVVERGGAEADHRRLPEAARRLVRARLAQPAHLAVGASGLGLRLYARRRRLGRLHRAARLRGDLVIETSQGADRSR